MIPFTDFGGRGPEMHFLHANGYPPACYLPLVELFKPDYHLSGMHLRPLWPHSRPKEIGAWHPMSEDLLLFLDENRFSPVIALGHSMGGIISLRAALHRPASFRALVLIEPVLFPPRFIAAFNAVKLVGLGSRLIPVMKGALKRRRHFEDLEKLFHSYRHKHVFRYLSDESLRAYINGITVPSPNGGYDLAYSPEWEARIYETGIWNDWDIWAGLKSLKVPTLIIRGAETDTFWESTGRLVRKMNPAIEIISLPAATHLVPLERPDEVSEITERFLKRLDKTPGI